MWRRCLWSSGQWRSHRSYTTSSKPRLSAQGKQQNIWTDNHMTEFSCHCMSGSRFVYKTNLGSKNFPEHFLEQERRSTWPAVLLGPVRLQSTWQLTLNLNGNCNLGSVRYSFVWHDSTLDLFVRGVNLYASNVNELPAQEPCSQCQVHVLSSSSVPQPPDSTIACVLHTPAVPACMNK